MGNRTPLYEAHVAAGAVMVDFSGWDMPVHYGSQVAEHQAVRSGAGMFDVSHMRAVDISGPGAAALLRRVLANDVAKLRTGRALYSCMCNEHGGVVDDVIAYRTAEDAYRVVLNCATADKDLAWLSKHADGQVEIDPRADLAILAVQGPGARAAVGEALGLPSADLPRFGSRTADGVFIGRTGYTGEDGVELLLSGDRVEQAWEALRAAGVTPAGLGARDTLRLEAGLNLYGNEMDEDVTPLECGLAWTVDLRDPERAFIGRGALEAQQVGTRFVGLVLAARGVMRSHQRVRTPEGEGVVTSGTFSPTLGRSIAMARIPAGPGATAEVEVRGRWLTADIMDLPFVRPQPEGAPA
jgi:aminomethyltransferase